MDDELRSIRKALQKPSTKYTTWMGEEVRCPHQPDFILVVTALAVRSRDQEGRTTGSPGQLDAAFEHEVPTAVSHPTSTHKALTGVGIAQQLDQ